MNKDFYDDLPGIVCVMLDELIGKYSKEEWFEKANEYIKENKDKYYHDWGEDDGSYDTYLDETEIDKLSNILNGGNNENN